MGNVNCCKKPEEENGTLNTENQLIKEKIEFIRDNEEYPHLKGQYPFERDNYPHDSDKAFRNRRNEEEKPELRDTTPENKEMDDYVQGNNQQENENQNEE